MHQAQRTQIYLPTELRREIDRRRAISGESLSDYLRKALRQRLEKERREKANLKKLAEEVTAGVKKSGWEDIDIIEWQRKIRKDRIIV